VGTGSDTIVETIAELPSGTDLRDGEVLLRAKARTTHCAAAPGRGRHPRKRKKRGTRSGEET
jgi:hypothetical protein